ncbi:MAG TPA: DUF433 domain-containing protein [Chloroflexota bacterium]|nr:DUF433 domain-containing protein [Chloroflexota bacterium]
MVDPDVRFGKPCVAGTRIPARDVLELVADAIPFDLIVRDCFPDLDVEDVRACARYAVEVVGAEDLHVAVGERGSCSTRRRTRPPSVPAAVGTGPVDDADGLLTPVEGLAPWPGAGAGGYRGRELAPVGVMGAKVCRPRTTRSWTPTTPLPSWPGSS